MRDICGTEKMEILTSKDLETRTLTVHSQSHPRESITHKYLRVLIFVSVLVLFSGNADNQFAKTAKQGQASGES